ncbi:hypothetical protein Ciccas_005701, partial [Cichlidogyrus casuarinus]
MLKRFDSMVRSGPLLEERMFSLLQNAYSISEGSFEHYWKKLSDIISPNNVPIYSIHLVWMLFDVKSTQYRCLAENNQGLHFTKNITLTFKLMEEE